MNTQVGKWLLAGVMAVSMSMANQRAQAHGDGTAEAVVTGLAIGAVAATLVRDDGHRHRHHHDSYREVHHYYDHGHRHHRHHRHCPPSVRVDHHYHGHRGGYYHDGGYRGHRDGYRDRYYDRGRSVIVNHF